MPHLILILNSQTLDTGQSRRIDLIEAQMAVDSK